MWTWRRHDPDLIYLALLDLQRTVDQLAIELGASLSLLHGKADSLMAKEQDLQDDLDAIKAGIAAGTPVSQAQLDALKSEADEIVAALSPLTA